MKGITKTDSEIILTVLKKPLPTMDLVERLGLVHSHVLDRIKILEAINFIERKREGRRVFIYPTSEGLLRYAVSSAIAKKETKLKLDEKNKHIIVIPEETILHELIHIDREEREDAYKKD